MSEASQALQKIARGTGIVFAGTVISMFFGFLSRAVIARYFSTGEYGVFNLALTVLNIVLVITTLGFQNALPREVAFYREKEPSKVKDLISTALMIVALNSIIWTAVLFAGAGNISRLFSDERLVEALRIVVFALPFWALTRIIISVLRGFGRVREQVYFQNIVYPTAFLVLILVGYLLKGSFEWIFIAYFLSQVITLFLLLIDTSKLKLLTLAFSFDYMLGKELLKFSLPIMLTGMLAFIMGWTDTLMLGYYKGPEVVGIYNAASPIAKLISIFLNSAAMLYLPIASSLYGRGKIKEMGRVYQIITKWVFLLTLPIFAIVFLFPEATINFFFGAKYIQASLALQILALGFMFHTFLGLNHVSLIIIGRPTLNLIGNSFATGLNVILNALLIPEYGPEGAAVATAFSYFVANIFGSYWLYKNAKIHPFNWSYVKLLVISFALLGIIKSLDLKVPNIWYTIPILMTFVISYLFLILLSKGIDKEDVELLLTIEQKLGVNLNVIKKILIKFV